MLIAPLGQPKQWKGSRADLRLLERRAEEDTDRADVVDARAALAESGENIPWEKVKTDLGL